MPTSKSEQDLHDAEVVENAERRHRQQATKALLDTATRLTRRLTKKNGTNPPKEAAQ